MNLLQVLHVCIKSDLISVANFLHTTLKIITVAVLRINVLCPGPGHILTILMMTTGTSHTRSHIT